MELELIRTYATGGTNGNIFYADRHIAYSIELPWKDNKTGVSCIPEGQYRLKKRFSMKLGWHLQVMDVPARDLVLIHPANDALLELQGCIAAVTNLVGEGRGTQSRAALLQLTGLVFAPLSRKETVLLIIKSGSYEPLSENAVANA